MYERIIEIIVLLVEELQRNQPINQETFADLNNQGYTQSEISAAFTWLVDRIQFGENLIADQHFGRSTSFRTFHETEQAAFTPEALGYLMEMRELDLISNAQMEMIIDRAMLGFQRVSVPQLKTMLSFLMFSPELNQSATARVLLNGTDTIH